MKFVDEASITVYAGKGGNGGKGSGSGGVGSFDDQPRSRYRTGENLDAGERVRSSDQAW